MSVSISILVVKLTSRLFSTVRSSPRSSNCKDFAKETIKPNISNIVSHSTTCPKMPTSSRYGAEKDAENPSQDQRPNMMTSYIQRGIANPAKKCTVMSKKSFRQHFVMGVIEDDLSYSFGERQGMKRLFNHLLPENYSVPGRKMVRRDLDLLFDCLSKLVNKKIEVCFSLHLNTTHTNIFLRKQSHRYP